MDADGVSSKTERIGVSSACRCQTDQAASPRCHLSAARRSSTISVADIEKPFGERCIVEQFKRHALARGRYMQLEELTIELQAGGAGGWPAHEQVLSLLHAFQRIATPWVARALRLQAALQPGSNLLSESSPGHLQHFDGPS